MPRSVFANLRFATTQFAAMLFASSVVVTLHPSAIHPAFAQSAGSAVAQAEQHFREGRALLDQGRFAEACRAFERSLELDSSPGTLLNLGNCYEQQGDLALALTTFDRAIVDSKLHPDKKKRQAWIDGGTRRRDSLLERVPVLTIEPWPEAGTVLKLDGHELPHIDGPLRVNPGHHVLELRRRGQPKATREFDLQPQQRLVVAPPALPESTPEPPPMREAPERRLPRRTAEAKGSGALPWLLMGSGAGLALVGGVTGLLASSKESELRRGCGPSGQCTDPGLESVRDSGQSLATATYVLWAVGGAGLAVGLTLIALDTSSEEEPARVSAGCFGAGCGVMAHGHF